MRRRPGPRTPAGRPARSLEVPLIPYRDWAERGPSTMRVWIPAEPAVSD
ncbi:hypothetical protein ACIA58_26780 [Kribbella sp. NPDC051586]